MGAQPLFEVTRGRIVESVHYGSIAVVDSNGKLISSYGDPNAVVFLRSSAKPFQAIPFVEHGGVEHFDFTLPELSISCAFHEGSDLHRSWFQSSQLEALATRGRPPYREVLTHGFLIDMEGRKMSKSVGNVIAPQDVIKESGAEIIRLWVASTEFRNSKR